jgi:hypothetical protein
LIAALSNIGELTIVGYCCDSLPERLVIPRQAVLIGTRVWAKALSGEIEVHWWKELGTRNYMRAIATYAATLREAGIHADADRCFARSNWMERGGHLTQENTSFQCAESKQAHPKTDAAPRQIYIVISQAITSGVRGSEE